MISGVVLERVRETVDHGVLNGTSLYSRKRTRVSELMLIMWNNTDSKGVVNG